MGKESENERVSIFDKSVFVDRWNYIKPTMNPDENGDIILVFQMSFGPCEWWKWSMDAQGKFWMEYRWCEDEFFEDESFREEQTKEQILEKIQYMQSFFRDLKIQEYVYLYKKMETYVMEK